MNNSIARFTIAALAAGAALSLLTGCGQDAGGAQRVAAEQAGPDQSSELAPATPFGLTGAAAPMRVAWDQGGVALQESMHATTVLRNGDRALRLTVLETGGDERIAELEPIAVADSQVVGQKELGAGRQLTAVLRGEGVTAADLRAIDSNLIAADKSDPRKGVTLDGSSGYREVASEQLGTPRRQTAGGSIEYLLGESQIVTLNFRQDDGTPLDLRAGGQLGAFEEWGGRDVFVLRGTSQTRGSVAWKEQGMLVWVDGGGDLRPVVDRVEPIAPERLKALRDASIASARTDRVELTASTAFGKLEIYRPAPDTSRSVVCLGVDRADPSCAIASQLLPRIAIVHHDGQDVAVILSDMELTSVDVDKRQATIVKTSDGRYLSVSATDPSGPVSVGVEAIIDPKDETPPLSVGQVEQGQSAAF